MILYDLTEDRQKLTLADWGTSSSGEDGVWRLAFSNDGRSIALGYGNGKIDVVDTVTGKAQQHYAGIASNVTSVAFSPDGRLLAAAGEDSETRPLPGSVLEPIKSLLGDNQQPTRKVIKIWNVASGQVFRVIHGPQGPVAFSGDGRLLASGPLDGRYKDDRDDRPVPLWHVDFGRIDSVVHGGNVHHGFGPDGETIAISGGGSLRLWDTSIGKERQVIRLCDAGGDINHVAFSPTGRYVGTANGNGTVYIMKIRWP
jgi:hypothetical protein